MLPDRRIEAAHKPGTQSGIHDGYVGVYRQFRMTVKIPSRRGDSE